MDSVQVEGLKKYCTSVGLTREGGSEYFLLEDLRLPEGCVPQTCDALLRPSPTPGDGYPSRLYLSVKVESPFTRNWNCINARVIERTWFAYSWMVATPPPTLVELLLSHLAGFTRAT